MSSKNPENNPYAQAAGAYGGQAQKTPDQRELEGLVLLKSARKLKEFQDDWENMTKDTLTDVLKYNRQLWMLFYDNAFENRENSMPEELRTNIINLANFIFKREVEILSEPQKGKLDVLISINKEIAAGLMHKPDAEKLSEE